MSHARSGQSDDVGVGCKTRAMAFGTPSGPPATHRQIGELLALLQAQGYTGFRDARGPMGFTQRQGGGKFTRDEAEAFITRLTSDAEAHDPDGDGAVAPGVVRPEPVSARERREARQRSALATVPSEVLAAELQSRGWAVIAP